MADAARAATLARELAGDGGGSATEVKPGADIAGEVVVLAVHSRSSNSPPELDGAAKASPKAFLQADVKKPELLELTPAAQRPTSIGHHGVWVSAPAEAIRVA